MKNLKTNLLNYTKFKISGVLLIFKIIQMGSSGNRKQTSLWRALVEISVMENMLFQILFCSNGARNYTRNLLPMKGRCETLLFQ